MSRYFFNLHDGHDFIDDVGSEHPDLLSVRAEAVESLGERMRWNLLAKENVSACIINVTNEAGFTVLIVSLSAAVQTVGTETHGDTAPPSSNFHPN